MKNEKEERDMIFEVKLFKLTVILIALIPCFKILSSSGVSSIYNNITSFGPLFQLCTTSTWKEFILNSDLPESKQKKWAWIGMIIMKSKIPLKLKTLNLHWYGKNIQDLQASLYQKKEKDPSLIPIQQNLVCDTQGVLIYLSR